MSLIEGVKVRKKKGKHSATTGYGNHWFSVQTASVEVGVRLGRRRHREAQPRPAGGAEADV